MKLLPLAASLILVWIAFQQGRPGVSVPLIMLFAGGSVYEDYLFLIGMLTFSVGYDKLWLGWPVGSAHLIAGGCADNSNNIGGIITFGVINLSAWSYWHCGSARCWWKCR